MNTITFSFWASLFVISAFIVPTMYGGVILGGYGAAPAMLSTNKFGNFMRIHENIILTICTVVTLISGTMAFALAMMFWIIS